jgi:hypothetical protein
MNTLIRHSTDARLSLSGHIADDAPVSGHL